MKKLTFVFCALIIAILLVSLVSALSLNDFSNFFKNFWQKISGKTRTTGMATESPTPTQTPTPTPTPSPAETPTDTPSPTPSPEAAPTASPIESPIYSPTPEPSPIKSPTPMPSPELSSSEQLQTFSQLSENGQFKPVYDSLAQSVPNAGSKIPKSEEIIAEAKEIEKGEEEVVREVVSIRKKKTNELVAELTKTKTGQVERLDIKFGF